MKQNVIISNDALGLVLPEDTGSQPVGTVALANEGRFTATHFSEALTAYAVGWRDPSNLADLLAFLAPTVSVSRRFEFKKAINSEQFLSETDDVRAIGSPFKRVDFGGETVNEKTLNKGLTVRVDHDDEVGVDWEERYVANLLQRLRRNEVRRVLALLIAGATNQAVTWAADSNPDADIRDTLSLATDKSGMRPNRIFMGEGAYDLRQDRYDGQNNAGAYAYAAMTLDRLATKLMVDEVRVSRERYQINKTTKQKIHTSLVTLLYYANQGITKDDPSNIKRFVSPTANGGDYAVYIEPHTKYTDITVEHYSNAVITSTLGLYMLTAAES